jgi:hypothetical protein
VKQKLVIHLHHEPCKGNLGGFIQEPTPVTPRATTLYYSNFNFIAHSEEIGIHSALSESTQFFSLRERLTFAGKTLPIAKWSVLNPSEDILGLF